MIQEEHDDGNAFVIGDLWKASKFTHVVESPKTLGLGSQDQLLPGFIVASTN